MTQHDFSSLYAHYAEVIEQMPDLFTSHAFTLALAQQHQRLYIEALGAYRDNAAPFRTVHGILAKHLYEYPELIYRDPPDADVPSVNIFGESGACAQWRRRV
jgi:hypothetical protein